MILILPFPTNTSALGATLRLKTHILFEDRHFIFKVEKYQNTNQLNTWKICLSVQWEKEKNL